MTSENGEAFASPFSFYRRKYVYRKCRHIVPFYLYSRKDNIRRITPENFVNIRYLFSITDCSIPQQ